MDEFDNFINNTRYPYLRSNPIGHITGSCWIINKNLDSVLLTHHKKLNIWIPTGGHAENENDPALIALREGEEETGLQLKLLFKEVFYKDIHIIPKYKETPKHKHFDFTYFFYPIGTEEFSVSSESHALKWIELNEIENYTHEKNVINMRDKTINLIKSGNLTILK